ncbi:MAG: hypothetical protein AAF212_05305 [Verrucomicrobiota bacterium]|mgnify:CR=1 FL=1
MIRFTKRSAFISSTVIAIGLLTASLINASERKHPHQGHTGANQTDVFKNSRKEDKIEAQPIAVYMLESHDSKLEAPENASEAGQKAEIGPIVININIYLDPAQLEESSSFIGSI